jgi:hypothetical protein
VLLQDMFHLHCGGKQRLARELVGRLSKARATTLSRAPSTYKPTRK